MNNEWTFPPDTDVQGFGLESRQCDADGRHVSFPVLGKSVCGRGCFGNNIRHKIP